MDGKIGDVSSELCEQVEVDVVPGVYAGLKVYLDLVVGREETARGIREDSRLPVRGERFDLRRVRRALRARLGCPRDDVDLDGAAVGVELAETFEREMLEPTDLPRTGSEKTLVEAYAARGEQLAKQPRHEGVEAFRRGA